MENILVIGFNTRNIVCSARRAGYRVFSLDAFQDFDLQRCAYASTLLEYRTAKELHQLDSSRIKNQINEFGLDGLELDAVILGSGLETLDRSIFSCPIFASSSSAVKEASNKISLSKRLEKLGVPHPQRYSTDELDCIEYPVMVKPAVGGGGIFNRIAKDKHELLFILEEFSGLDPDLEKTVLIQAFLEGIPLSISLLSTKREALSVAVNEQLIGVSWLTRLPFAYCGNITPFRTEKAGEMEEIAEDIILNFGLEGSNGVDFLLTENGPVVLEINPRFQGSLDTVEKATGLNLFEAHIGCFEGRLPEKPIAKCFAARGILYSDRELFIDRELMDVILGEEAADIPLQGTIIEPDWPVTSLFSCTPTKEEAVLSLEKRAEKLKTFIENQTKNRNKPKSYHKV